MNGDTHKPIEEQERGKPRRLKSKFQRECARRVRDMQWHFMERVRDRGKIWLCPWNKHGMPELEDELRLDLLSWCEWEPWMERHKDWFIAGRWSEKRCAFSVRLSDAGLRALENRCLYDDEDVEGGLIEPGVICAPALPGERRAT